MKFTVALSLLLVAITFAQTELPLAEDCNPTACQLPECRCTSRDIPGGFAARDIPQFVTLTFDDAVNSRNIVTYRALLFSLRNSNGCRASSTYYVNHEYTDYSFVNELYNHGQEIALHSISHQEPQTYWFQANYNTMAREIGDQRAQMAHFANIPYDSIKGVRLPFLQLAGNHSFHVMADFGLEYDCTWPTTAQTNPPIWPYSLHYASSQDCVIGPCPTASIPGPWVYPMVSWTDLQGFPCSMIDACFAPPALTDEDAWYNFILTNFERHYFSNRAPFPIFLHEWFVEAYPAVYNALDRFLKLIPNLPDVYLVSSSEVVDYVKNPITIEEYRNKPCRTFIPTPCPATTCPLTGAHNNVQYWMTICNVCPRVYPWLGNPLGQ